MLAGVGGGGRGAVSAGRFVRLERGVDSGRSWRHSRRRRPSSGAFAVFRTCSRPAGRRAAGRGAASGTGDVAVGGGRGRRHRRALRARARISCRPPSCARRWSTAAATIGRMPCRRGSCGPRSSRSSSHWVCSSACASAWPAAAGRWPGPVLRCCPAEALPAATSRSRLIRATWRSSAARRCWSWPNSPAPCRPMRRSSSPAVPAPKTPRREIADKDQILSMVRSLDDPKFVGRVAAVTSDLTYHVEFAGAKATRIASPCSTIRSWCGPMRSWRFPSTRRWPRRSSKTCVTSRRWKGRG